MTDIVERLRQVTEDDAYALPWTFGETCKEAADEIVRLRSLATQHHQGGAEAALRAALEEIVDPISAMRQRAADDGAKIDGLMAVTLSKDPEYLRGIARSALAQQPLSVPSPLPTPSAWQPIETAPKDGSDILLSDSRVKGGFQTVASYELVDGSDWVWHTNDGPAYHLDAFTHWQPLPFPPSVGGKEEYEEKQIVFGDKYLDDLYRVDRNGIIWDRKTGENVTDALKLWNAAKADAAFKDAKERKE